MGDLLPPTLVVEVVSLGETARDRDYKDQREQYEARGIPEYWLIDPEQQSVMVLALTAGKYSEIGTFCGSERIYSPTFGDLQLTAQQIFTAGR